MYISRVIIKNYRSIKDLTLSFNSGKNVIVGKNNSGKSNIIKAIDSVKAPIMYVSNLVTQPGETDKYNVSDHIKKLNEYLGKRKVNVVLANNAKVDTKIKKKYFKEEKKELVKIDKKSIEKENTRLIEDNIFSIEDGTIRHNSLKTAYLIFSYLMEGE